MDLAHFAVDAIFPRIFELIDEGFAATVNDFTVPTEVTFGNETLDARGAEACQFLHDVAPRDQRLDNVTAEYVAAAQHWTATFPAATDDPFWIKVTPLRADEFSMRGAFAFLLEPDNPPAMHVVFDVEFGTSKHLTTVRRDSIKEAIKTAFPLRRRPWEVVEGDDLFGPAVRFSAGVTSFSFSTDGRIALETHADPIDVLARVFGFPPIRARYDGMFGPGSLDTKLASLRRPPDAAPLNLIDAVEAAGVQAVVPLVTDDVDGITLEPFEAGGLYVEVRFADGPPRYYGAGGLRAWVNVDVADPKDPASRRRMADAALRLVQFDGVAGGARRRRKTAAQLRRACDRLMRS